MRNGAIYGLICSIDFSKGGNGSFVVVIKAALAGDLLAIAFSLLMLMLFACQTTAHALQIEDKLNPCPHSKNGFKEHCKHRKRLRKKSTS